MDAQNQAAVPQNALQPENQGGLTATTLKIIAIAAMTIDHFAWMFVSSISPLGIIMHFIGRITGPVMFYFIGVGYHHTKDVRKYTARLGIFALVSYVPFIFFESGQMPGPGNWQPFSVMYTLLLCLLAVRAFNEISSYIAKIIVIIIIFALSVYGDWGIFAIAYTLAFEIFRTSFKKQAIAYSLILILLTLLPSVGSYLSINKNPAMYASLGFDIDELKTVLPGQIIMQCGQFLPLILLRFYNGQRGGSGKPIEKWFFYIYYPALLVVLAFIRYFVLGTGAGIQ